MPAKRPSTKAKARPRAPKSRRAKVDVSAEHKNEYGTSAMPAFVKVGPAKYLAIIGRGKAGADEFNTAVGALYNVAFTVKMARKKAGSDYVVTKLEGLWWLDPNSGTVTADTVWNWQLMLRVPSCVAQAEIRTAIAQLIAKGKPLHVRRVQLIELREGMCVQILHVGPYIDESRSIAKMRAFADEAGRRFNGPHHEIYLSDPRRVKPEKLRTILRYPVA